MAKSKRIVQDKGRDREILTGLGNTNALDTLGCAFNKEIHTIVPELSNNHASTAKLRDKLKASKDSKLNGNLQRVSKSAAGCSNARA